MQSNYFENKIVAVTGASGFLGTNYLKKLLQKGAKVRASQHSRKIHIEHENLEIHNVDLMKIDDCLRFVDGAEIVIHSGGNIAHPSTVPTDIQISLQNINTISNVIDACNRVGTKKFFELNSSTGYADRRYPIEEHEFFEDEPFSAYYGYGWMRRYREKLMEHVSKFSGLEIALARCTAIFGPHDNFNLKTCHVVPALIKRVLSDENPFTAWGSPDVVRDFLYVKDVVNGALLILEKGESMKPYNLGYGNGITIGEILNAILTVTGKNLDVIWDDSKPTTIPFRAVSTDRIKNELGFNPKYTFEEGIKETIEWYIEKNFTI